MNIDAASPGDLPGVRSLLEHHHLPLAGVDELVPTTIVARDDGRVVGAAALELYADGALLRSVAVAATAQDRKSVV